MELIQLTSDYEMKPFDCGDAALNGFLCDSAKPFSEYRLAKTYLLCDGRFAVSLQYRGRGIGSKLLDIIKRRLKRDIGDSQFRFLTVDAYLDAVPFYERNGFRKLTPTREQGDTQAMYFDIQSVIET